MEPQHLLTASTHSIHSQHRVTSSHSVKSQMFPLVLAPRPLVCGPAHGPVQFLMSCDGQLLQIMYRIGKHRHASAFLPPTSLSFAPCLFTARRLRRFWGLQLPAASARFFGWDGAHAALPATRVETKLDDRSFFPDDGNYTFFWSPAWQSVIVPDITNIMIYPIS